MKKNLASAGTVLVAMAFAASLVSSAVAQTSSVSSELKDLCAVQAQKLYEDRIGSVSFVYYEAIADGWIKYADQARQLPSKTPKELTASLKKLVADRAAREKEAKKKLTTVQKSLANELKQNLDKCKKGEFKNAF